MCAHIRTLSSEFSVAFCALCYVSFTFHDLQLSLAIFSWLISVPCFFLNVRKSQTSFKVKFYIQTFFKSLLKILKHIGLVNNKILIFLKLKFQKLWKQFLASHQVLYFNNPKRYTQPYHLSLYLKIINLLWTFNCDFIETHWAFVRKILRMTLYLYFKSLDLLPNFTSKFLWGLLHNDKTSIANFSNISCYT